LFSSFFSFMHIEYLLSELQYRAAYDIEEEANCQ